ncbi:MAG: winged helix-turn-helix transcriptional regulator [Candidatus Lokiarchaeia archaeon]
MLERIEDYEFKIIDEIGKDLNTTQRKISRQIGLSLGMTNLIMKRLIAKGYVKVKGLSRRNVQYVLTPRGFTEKVRKTHRYLLRTIDTLKTVKEKIQDTVLEYYKKGERNFIILGKGELADIVEISLRDMGKGDLQYSRVRTPEEINSKGSIILLVDRNIQKRNNRYLNVLEVISEKIDL